MRIYGPTRASRDFAEVWFHEMERSPAIVYYSSMLIGWYMSLMDARRSTGTAQTFTVEDTRHRKR
jgi:hypothetical protein